MFIAPFVISSINHETGIFKMSGRLGKADLAAATNTDVYTVPAGKIACININNRNASNRSIRLAIRQGTLGNSDCLEYDVIIPNNSVLERTGLVLSAGETVVARASGAGVSIRVHGFLEDM